MTKIFIFAFPAVLLALVFTKVRGWRRNYGLAKTTGLPTFYSPVHVTDMWWLMVHPILAPFLKCFPRGWQMPWLPLSQVWNIWKVGHRPFAEAGSDSLMLATPNGNMLWTCDPAIIKQLFTLHTVHIPVDMLRFYDIWGPTIGTVEGEEWKTHRKVVAYGLNPSSLPTVWKEAIHQTDTLIERWATDKYGVKVPKYWTSRLALHTIASVFFDLKLEWKDYSASSGKTTEEYKMSFASALFTVLARMGMIFAVPRTLLRIIPLKPFREAHIAFTDLTKYMQDLRAKAAQNIEKVAAKRTKTILESIVLAGTASPSNPDNPSLSEASVLGNIFFTLMAGHETAGNTLAFTLLLLAVYPEHQIAIHADLDAHFGSLPKEQWTQEKDFQALQKTHLGAVLKEVLRLYNVIQFIFRFTVAPTTVHDSKGIPHVIPAGTTCLINYAAAFQNPGIWPQKSGISKERRAELHNSPAIDFDPGHWLDRGDEELDENYWPFGYGGRKCPGMPFAQVEMVAVLATLLKEYSVELVVSEEALNRCAGDPKKAWEQTRDQAIRQLGDDVEANLTIQMVKELPIRLVKRTR